MSAKLINKDSDFTGLQICASDSPRFPFAGEQVSIFVEQQSIGFATVFTEQG